MKNSKKIVLAITLSVVVSCFTISGEAQAQSFIWPVPGCSNITSPYGPRGTSGYVHSGTDISCGRNEPILAAASGTIVKITKSSGQCTYNPNAGTCPTCDNSSGNSVTIDHGNGYKTAYLHLKQFADGIYNGATVSCGQQLGIMGTTGCSTGTHLHFMFYVNGSHTNAMNYVSFSNNTCACVPSPEVCDGRDNDCDGEIDEGFVCEPDAEVMYQSQIYDPQNTDINGDGLADLCARGAAGVYCEFSSKDNIKNASVVLGLSNEQGWADVSNYATIHFADINGDGKADLCARSDAGIQCWLSNGNGFGASVSGPSMSDTDGYNNVKYYSTIRFADINGDGKDDVCARFKDGFKCYRSNGNGFDGTPIHTNEMSDSQGWGEEKYYSTIRMGDVNGDGKADVCARGIVGMRCWISTGTSFNTSFTATSWSNSNGWENKIYYTTIRMPDINGDGKNDICARDSQGVVCHLSNGSSFGDAIRGPGWSDNWGWNDYDNYSTLQFGDINGDGKDDVCARANANVSCLLSTGSGFGQEYSISAFSDANGWNKPAQFRTIRIGDINGDGRMDICGRASDGVKCFKFNGSGFDQIDGPDWTDAWGWSAPQYYSTFRFGGPFGNPCSKRAEVCDGVDNNCNGQIDEGDVCKPQCVPTTEVCDGIDNDCDGEIDEGDVCKPQCVPTTEVCDGQDNDCDGLIDEDDVCKPQCEPSDEICDGLDNDCDGEIDEDDVCKPQCVPTEEICDAQDNDCDGEVDEDNVCCIPEPEVCDMFDNDCDGEIDEDNVCDTCIPEPEVCDGRDNDCNGVIDDGDVCVSDFGYEGQIYYRGSIIEEDCACKTHRSSRGPAPLSLLAALAAVAAGYVLRRRKE